MRKLACLMLTAMCAPALAQQMDPGEWEFTSTMTSPAMPQPHVMKYARCMKKEDLDPSRWAGKQQGKTDCSTTPARRSGGTYTWEVTCPSSGMRGTGTAKVARDSVESEMRITGGGPGKKFEMFTRTTGTRLGPCKP
jgi:hypothetical protein